MFALESLRTEKGQPHSPSSHRRHLLLLEEKANRKQELHEQKRYPKCVLCWQQGSFCRNESSVLKRRSKKKEDHPKQNPTLRPRGKPTQSWNLCLQGQLVAHFRKRMKADHGPVIFTVTQNRKWNEFCQSFTRFEQLQASTEDAHVHAGWSEGQTVESITVLMLTATWCYCQWK